MYSSCVVILDMDAISSCVSPHHVLMRLKVPYGGQLPLLNIKNIVDTVPGSDEIKNESSIFSEIQEELAAEPKHNPLRWQEENIASEKLSRLVDDS